MEALSQIVEMLKPMMFVCGGGAVLWILAVRICIVAE